MKKLIQILKESEEDDFGWVPKSKPFSNDWMIINDIKDEDPYMIYSQKYLFSINQKWRGGSQKPYVTDITGGFHSLHGEDRVFGFFGDDSSDLFKRYLDATTEVYYNSHFKDINIVSESEDDFKWADDIKPTFEDLFDHGLLSVGDVIILDGDTLDVDGKMVKLTNARYEMTNVNEHFNTCKVMADRTTVKALGLAGPFELCDDDGSLVVIEHIKDINMVSESEDDGFDWARDIGRQIPITELHPGDEYYIISLSNGALYDYNNDSDLEQHDPYSTMFRLDDDHSFELGDENYFDSVDHMGNIEGSVWVRVKDDNIDHGGWVNIDTIIVQRMYN